jgi:hypothetical protein
MIRAITLNDDELVRGEMGRTDENSPPIYCNNHQLYGIIVALS